MIKSNNLTVIRCNYLKIARLITLFLILSVSFSHASNSYSQSTRLTLSISNKPIKDVFDAIENQSEYLFFYYGDVIDVNKKVSIKAENEPTEVVLDKLLSSTGNTYKISDRQILISKSEESSAVKDSKQDTRRKINGIVIDSDTGEEVIGVSIVIKGTTTGTITDVNGRFEIDASPSDELIVTYIGYTQQDIKVGNRTTINIQLSETEVMMQEVVITSSFGTGQAKETVVGAIQTIRPGDLRGPSSNLSASFAGRMAGVVAYQRSGQPGDNAANFYIRGISTMSGMTSPLIILDGVEVSANDLNALDPEIIDGFSILKDATASALYGTRGANGVMIVNTKSGIVSEKPIIGFRVETNITTPTKKPKFANAVDYMRLYNEAVTNQGTGDILFSDDRISGTLNNLDPYVYPNVNWYDEIFNSNALNQKVNFNIRGGTQKITYFMNLAVNHESGMMKNRSKDFFSYDSNINLMKYAFQNNIDFNMSKSSKISLHLNVLLEDLRGPTENNGGRNKGVEEIYGSIMNNNPVDFPTFFPRSAGENTNWIKWGALQGGNDQGATNPLALATRGYQDSFNSTVIANINFKQKLDFLVEGLQFGTLVSFKNWSRTWTSRRQGYNRYALGGHTIDPDGAYDYNLIPVSGEPSKPILETEGGNSGDRRIYLQENLEYNGKFDDHHVGGLLVATQDQFNNNIATSLIPSLPKRKLGFAGRLSYSYAHRYMLELNAGYTGSENFAKGHRWGFFPSVAAGWNISQEPFWKPYSHIVNNFKLRGSYGLVGNDQINDERFIYLSEINLQDTNDFTTGFGNNKESHKGPVYIRFQNDDITWEVGKKINLGLDLQLFNSLTLVFDVFREDRSDIFQEKNSIPNYLGTAKTKLYGNFARVRNQGFDMSIDYGKQINNDLAIMFKGTFTYARNKVLEYDEGAGTRPALSQIGKRLRIHYGYISNGLYIDQADIANNPTSTLGNIAIAPGDIKYKDQPDYNGEYDGRITSDDRVPLGHPTVPEIVYGFGPSVAWKKWDFSFFFQGVANTSLMMSGFHPFGAQYNRNVLTFISEDYWSKENQNIDAKYPRLTKFENNHNSRSSDFWLRSAAFLKLKNAEIGYSVSRPVRIYVSGVNLLTFSSFKHWDPEMGGGAGLKYPTQRTLNVGLQVSL